MAFSFKNFDTKALRYTITLSVAYPIQCFMIMFIDQGLPLGYMASATQKNKNKKIKKTGSIKYDQQGR